MTNLFRLCLVLCLGLASLEVYAQSTRYVDPIFARNQVRIQRDVLYHTANENFYNPTEPVELYMDLYLPPTSDTVTRRPILLLSPGGSFLPASSSAQPQSPLGSMRDYPLVELATVFAQRGWVVAMVDYRRGWNPTSSDREVRERGIIRAAYRAVQDGKAAVRYIKKSFAEDNNPYGIDTNRIAYAGSQAGAYIPLHMLALDTYDKVLNDPKLLDGNNEPYIDTLLLGGIRGTGYLQYGDDIQCAVSLGGAVLDTNYIESYHPPILNMHGDADAVTPFFTAVVTPAASGLPIVEVSGGHDFGKRAENIGINNVLKPEFESDFFLGFYPFFGAGFQPYAWYDGGTPQQEVIARRYLDTVITFLAPRLKKVLDLPTITSRNERRLLDDARLDVYPNPTRDIVTIKLEHASAKMEQIVVRDMMGREVLRTLPVDGLHTVFPVHSFSPGLYFLDIHTTIGIESRKLMVE